MPLPSSRRALSALTVIGVLESRSKARVGLARLAARMAASIMRIELSDDFITTFHLGVEFQNSFIDPRFHTLGPGSANAVGNGYRIIGIDDALIIVQSQAFRIQRRFPVTNRTHHTNIARKVCLLYTSPSPRDGLLS